MNPRRTTLVVALFACWSGAPAAAGQSPDLRPIVDRSVRIEVPGISVLPPQGDRWFVLPVSPQERVPEDGIIRFVNQVRETAPERPEDVRQVTAGLVVTDSENAAPAGPDEFLQGFTSEFKGSIGQMITARQRLVSFDAALDSSHGATCIKYTRLTEISGQFPAFPDFVAVSSTLGLYCMHPKWPQYHVDVTYQQIYQTGQNALARDEESDAFLKSVSFTPERPVAAPALKALYLSFMQTADTAYREREWADAEASLRSALQVVEKLDPNDPLVGMTLYYLASVEQHQGRPAEAEPLFRRAMGVFEAQPSLDSVEIARVYVLTLSDLAVLYAADASRATSPDLKQRQFESAENLLGRALALQEKVDPNEVGRTLGNLTQLYVDSARWDDAAEAARRAVSFYEQQRGREDVEVIKQLDRLVDIYLQQGRFAEVEQIIGRVLGGMQAALGPSHPVIIRRLETYADGLRKGGLEAEANEVEAEADKIRIEQPPAP